MVWDETLVWEKPFVGGKPLLGENLQLNRVVVESYLVPIGQLIVPLWILFVRQLGQFWPPESTNYALLVD